MHSGWLSMRFVACYSREQALLNRSPLQVFADERPFAHLFPCAVLGRILAGKRPSRLTNRAILGLSEDVQMEECWDHVPSVRPHIADVLTLFEMASRSWVSPTPEAVANLDLNRQTIQNSPMTEPVGLMSETEFGTTGGGAVSPHEAGESPPRSNGEVHIQPRSAFAERFRCRSLSRSWKKHLRKIRRCVPRFLRPRTPCYQLLHPEPSLPLKSPRTRE